MNIDARCNHLENRKALEISEFVRVDRFSRKFEFYRVRNCENISSQLSNPSSELAVKLHWFLFNFSISCLEGRKKATHLAMVLK